MNDRILHGDAFKLLPEIIQSGIKVDLILTDPPYNVGVAFSESNRDKVKPNVFLQQNEELADSYYELLTDDGSVVTFMSQSFLVYTMVAMMEHGLKFRQMMAWMYRNGMKRQLRMPTNAFDPILWYTKSNNWTYNCDDLRIPYRQPDRRKYGDYRKKKDGTVVWYGPNPLGSAHTNVWEVPALTGKKVERTGHPTQKPIALIIDLIKGFCPKGRDGMYEGVVMDPFLGSGTLGVCCEMLNKEGHRIEWFGIEAEKKWCDLADKRVAEVWDEPPNSKA